jgi:hypothetical protein
MNLSEILAGLTPTPTVQPETPEEELAHKLRMQQMTQQVNAAPGGLERDLLRAQQQAVEDKRLQALTEKVAGFSPQDGRTQDLGGAAPGRFAEHIAQREGRAIDPATLAEGSRGMAQLALGGGKASIGGTPLFGGASSAPEAPKVPLRPSLQEMLTTADQMANSLLPKKPTPSTGDPVSDAFYRVTPETNPAPKKLLPNPFGPGSFDPSDPQAVAAIKEQQAKNQKVEETKKILQSVGANPLLKGSQGEIVKNLLQNLGVIKSPEDEAYDKAKGQAAGAIAGGKIAKSAELDGLLSAEDAGRLGVPYGTTKRQAAEQGSFSMTAAQRNTLTEIGKARQIADKLAGLTEKLAEKYGSDPGVLNRVFQGLKNKKAGFDQEDTDLLEYTRLKEAFLTNIARSVGNEKGNLSKEEGERARGFFPNLDSWTPDTKKGVKRMTEALGTFLDQAEEKATGGALKPKKGGTPAGIPQGAVPTGRTSGGKPVFKGPDGKLYVED